MIASGVPGQGSGAAAASLGPLPLAFALLALASYLVAMWPAGRDASAARDGVSARRSAALLAGWLAHGALLAMDIAGLGRTLPGARLGFGPVMSLSVWLVLGVHAVEQRLLPLPAVRRALAMAGAAGVLLAWAFPGEVHAAPNALAPWHWLLGVASYALFGAAVLHGWMLDRAERAMRPVALGGGAASDAAALAGWGSGLGGGAPHLRLPSVSAGPLGIPLLKLERLTFRFVQVGFGVLSAAIVFGWATGAGWRTTHKTVFSLLAWAVFGALLWGRHARGWRGRRALRFLYGGAALLLLGYAGSRFVFEVVLGRAAT